jgi:S-adenosylmethionine:tRNA ribosyltransferase-isomerase
MKTSDFDYHLPEHLIAQTPCAIRSHSRLLHYSRCDKAIQHRLFTDIIDLLKPEDLLVFNNTRVIPARIYGHKETGGKVEILIERLVNERQCLAHIRASKTPKPGSTITLSDQSNELSFSVTVKGREDDLFILVSTEHDMATIMQSIGHMPLPPYIARDDDIEDFSRYQTVYADSPGAVAAPTAGLHFDEKLLQSIRDKGIDSAFVTLHVGAGTFQPVRSERLEDHLMHREYLTVPQETVNKCQQARQRGGRIVAIGTTTVRSLETASKSGQLEVYTGETDIFIYPGYTFNSVDALLTNFHLPESTLLMLISALVGSTLAGKDEIMRCYTEAIAEQYRFFSYGDAMLIT